MKQLSILVMVLLAGFFAKAQCLTATNGQYPSTTFTPSCTGAAESITTVGYAGEYSKVKLTSGSTYSFSSSITTDFITISDKNGTAAYTFGTTPVTYTATATDTVRFYTHTNASCGESSTSRTRLIQCILPPCTAPAAQPTALSLTATLTTVNGNFTAPATAPSGYLVVRYPGGTTTPALPSSGTTYIAGNTITASGRVTGTVVYAGTSTSFTASGLSGSTSYDFVVYAYTTGTGCGISYNTTITAGQNKATITTASCTAFPSVIAVGASSTYTNLTAVAGALGACPVTAPVSVQLQADYSSASETFPITINPVNGANLNNTVTIRPAAGVTASITGSAASGPIMKILSSYVTVDGSNNGTTSRNLTISNTSTTSPQVMLIGSTGTTPIVSVTVKNSTIINGANSSSAVIISDGTTAANAGYFNNITIQNNSVQRAYVGIYSIATVAGGNGTGLNISGNDLSTSGTNAIRLVGIYVQGVDGATVANNTIGNFETASAEFDRGIWFATGSSNGTISGNTISTLAYTGTSTYAPIGISISPAINNANITVTNNTISGLTSAGTGISVGLYGFSTSTGLTFSRNKVGNIKSTNASGGAYGIQLAATGTTGANTVVNNFVYDIAGVGSATAANNGHGIAITAATVNTFNYIWFNSVHMNTNQNVAAGISAALFVGSGVTAAGVVYLTDNILVNSENISAGQYAVYNAASSNVFGAMESNDYYTVSGNLSYTGGSNQTSLSALQAAFGGNSASKNIQPVFASLTDLHLPLASNSALANLGQALPGITVDIDNQTRDGVVPDMGADEFDVPLPVTFLSFKGERKYGINQLSWETATEVNNSGFELQRSANGSDYSKVVFIISKAVNGTSSLPVSYDYSDVKPLAGANFYRLRQVDKDGRSTYSQVVMLKGIITTQVSLSNLYPNPTPGNLTATFQSPGNEKITLLISGMDGRVVWQKTVSLATGDNQVSIDVRKLSSGNYLLKTIAADGMESNTKFVKQ